MKTHFRSGEDQRHGEKDLWEFLLFLMPPSFENRSWISLLKADEIDELFIRIWKMCEEDANEMLPRIDPDFLSTIIAQK